MQHSTTGSLSTPVSAESSIRPSASKESFTSVFASRKNPLVQISVKSVLSFDSHSSLAVAPWYPRDADSRGEAQSPNRVKFVRYPSRISRREEHYELRLGRINLIKSHLIKLKDPEFILNTVEFCFHYWLRAMQIAGFEATPLDDHIISYRALRTELIALLERYLQHLSGDDWDNSFTARWDKFLTKVEEICSEITEILQYMGDAINSDVNGLEKAQYRTIHTVSSSSTLSVDCPSKATLSDHEETTDNQPHNLSSASSMLPPKVNTAKRESQPSKRTNFEQNRKYRSSRSRYKRGYNDTFEYSVIRQKPTQRSTSESKAAREASKGSARKLSTRRRKSSRAQYEYDSSSDSDYHEIRRSSVSKKERILDIFSRWL